MPNIFKAKLANDEERIKEGGNTLLIFNTHQMKTRTKISSFKNKLCDFFFAN